MQADELAEIMVAALRQLSLVTFVLSQSLAMEQPPNIVPDGSSIFLVMETGLRWLTGLKGPTHAAHITQCHKS